MLVSPYNFGRAFRPGIGVSLTIPCAGLVSAFMAEVVYKDQAGLSATTAFNAVGPGGRLLFAGIGSNNANDLGAIDADDTVLAGVRGSNYGQTSHFEYVAAGADANDAIWRDVGGTSFDQTLTGYGSSWLGGECVEIRLNGTSNYTVASDGAFAEVRIYSRLMLHDEVVHAFSKGAYNLPLIETGLVARHTFSEAEEITWDGVQRVAFVNLIDPATFPVLVPESILPQDGTVQDKVDHVNDPANGLLTSF